MDPQTAEAGEAYLNSMGFRSLIEWITAEALLSRPEDPLAFIRTIIDEKISDRPSGKGYSADHAVLYIKQCYAAASASADENGRITIKPRKTSTAASIVAPMAQTAVDQSLTHRLAILEKVIASCRLIAMQLDPNEASQMVIKQACAVLNAERATIFSHEPGSDMLVLKVAEGAADIRVPLSKGIAGAVASTGKILNILDAYTYPNFDSTYDIKTGYKTKSILCAPIRNGDGKIVGVMQVLNKIGGDKNVAFTEMDEEILMMLAAQAGVALNNAKTHRLAVIAREKVKDVLSIVQDMHSDLGFSPLMFTISTRVQKLVDSDRCTLYIVDHSKGELWTLQGEVNIRVPMNQGIAGAVATDNTTVNIPDAYEDPRFKKDFDQKSGYRTKSVLAMPLRNRKGEVIAVIQLINKRGEDDSNNGVFTADDEEILRTFLNIAGPILESSQSHLKTQHDEEQAGTEFTGKLVQTRANHETIEMNVITENEDEEES